MERTRFDGLDTALSAPSSRRQTLKLLAAGAASGFVAVAGIDAAGAKKRKKKKKKQKTCQPLGSVNVPATGATVNTPSLRKGQRYTLRAVGFWLTNATFGNDAFAAFPFANPNAPETTFQGVRLGLSVDGGSPDQWGSYNPNHIYERQVVGTGAPLSLRFTDPATNDNSGSLLVEIICA